MVTVKVGSSGHVFCGILFLVNKTTLLNSNIGKENIFLAISSHIYIILVLTRKHMQRPYSVLFVSALYNYLQLSLLPMQFSIVILE